MNGMEFSMKQMVSDFILHRLTEWGIHLSMAPGGRVNGFLGAYDRADGAGST